VRYVQDRRAVAQTYANLITCTYKQRAQNNTRELTLLRAPDSTCTGQYVHRTMIRLGNTTCTIN